MVVGWWWWADVLMKTRGQVPCSSRQGRVLSTELPKAAIGEGLAVGCSWKRLSLKIVGAPGLQQQTSLGVNEAVWWVCRTCLCLVYSWEFSGIPKIALETHCVGKRKRFLRTYLLSGMRRNPEFKYSKKPGSCCSKPPQNSHCVEDEFLSTFNLERSIQKQLCFKSCSARVTKVLARLF